MYGYGLQQVNGRLNGPPPSPKRKYADKNNNRSLEGSSNLDYDVLVTGSDARSDQLRGNEPIVIS